MRILKEVLNGVLLVAVFAFMMWLPEPKVNSYEREELAISGNNHQPSRTTQAAHESDRSGTARERSQRQERLVTFTFTRTE